MRNICKLFEEGCKILIFVFAFNENELREDCRINTRIMQELFCDLPTLQSHAHQHPLQHWREILHL